MSWQGCFMKRICIKNISYFSIILLLVSLIITPYYVRGIFLPEKIKSLNILAYLSIIMLFIYNFKKYKKKMLMIIAIISLIFIYSQSSANKEILATIKTYLGIIVPLFLIGINLNKETFTITFTRFIKIYNLFIMILVFIGIIDHFMGNVFAKGFSYIFNDSGYLLWAMDPTRNRYLSYMGHPLYNTELFLIFFVLNNLYNKYFEKIIPYFVISLISIVGIGLTGSKTGLVLIVIGIILLSIKNKKAFITQIPIMILGAGFGVFSTTITRLSTETLTTGRSKYWVKVMQYNMFPIKFFSGYGSGFTFDYNKIMAGASAAFEYPIRLFSLEYGILFTIMLYIVLFIYPIIILIRRKHFGILIGFMVVFIDVNTFNGIGLAQDHMFTFCLFELIIINLSNYIEKIKLKI